MLTLEEDDELSNNILTMAEMIQRDSSVQSYLGNPPTENFFLVDFFFRRCTICWKMEWTQRYYICYDQLRHN